MSALRRALDEVGSAARAVCESLEDRLLLSAGDPDPTFGTGGKVLLPDTAVSVHYTVAVDAVQGDGKIVLAGAASAGPNSQLFLERLNADGSVDSSFGNQGIVVRGTYSVDSILIQPDNRILVGGHGFLARFNANGSPDLGFGIAGVAPALSSLQSIALAPDGKILDAGATGNQFTAERHDANGAIDLSFNGTGSVSRLTTESFAQLSYSFATIGVQRDGRVLVGSSFKLSLGLWRFNADGSTDASFGEGGLTWTPLPYISNSIGYNWGVVSRIVLQPEGRILVAGAENVNDEWAVAWVLSRFNPDGSLDSRFGQNGLAEFIGGPGYPDIPDYPGGLALQSDGKIVIGGHLVKENEAPIDGRGPFLVKRLLPDGTVDPSFHSPDLTAFGPNDLDAVGATALTPDGKIVIAGNVVDGTHISDQPFQSLPSGILVARLTSGAPAVSVATPYLAHPFNLGADTIEAENFDNGPDGVAYHDSTPRNLPGQYRDTAVDIAAGGGASNGFYVTDTTPGEWLGYRTYAPVTGNYTFQARLSAAQPGGAFHLEIDGLAVTGSIAVPNTGVAQAWQTVSLGTVHLLKGTHVMRVVIDAAPAGGSAGNFDFFKASLAAPIPVVPGGLDPTFGSDGRQLVDDPDPNSDVQHRVKAVAVQSDGEILLAGSVGTRAANGVGEFFLERLNADGSIDTSFGAGGSVQTVIGPVSFATSLLLLPGGRILVGGATEDSATATTNASFALAVYKSDGSLDPTFGNGGIVVTDFAGNEEVDSLAMDPNGKIVAAGAYFLYPNVGFDIARYNATGSLDTTFNHTGMLSYGLGQTGGNSAPVGVATDSAGRILVAAHSGNDPAVFRFTAAGPIDASFGASGVAAITQIEVAATFRSLALQPDGRILAGGQTALGGSGFPLARFNPNGSLDASFGSQGLAVGGNAFLTDGMPLVGIFLQPDGKVLLVANQVNQDALDDSAGIRIPRFVVTRYQANGQFDPTFVEKDPGFLPPPPWSNELAEGAALGPDGKLVVAGDVLPYQTPGQLHWIGVARYVTQNPWLPGDINQDGKVDFNDLLTLAQNYGRFYADWSMGDFNADGQVDFNDLLAMAQNYGKSPPTAAAALAPDSLSVASERIKLHETRRLGAASKLLWS